MRRRDAGAGCGLAAGAAYIVSVMTHAFSPWIGPRWPALALVASAAMLASAHAFERFGGLEPCSLCLRQREAYWAAGAIAAAALAAGWAWPRARAARVGSVMLALAFLTSALIAGYHAGVEWKFWPGPTTCASSPVGALPADLWSALEGAKRVVPCDEAAWRMFGISMAGYNTLISLALAGLSGWSAVAVARAEDFDE